MAKDWIKGAIKKPGALKNTAKKDGAIGKNGDIKSGWLNKEAKKPGKTGARARLAKTLKKMH